MKQTIVIALLACAVGLIVGIDIGKHSPHEHEEESTMSHDMHAMASALEGKTGEAFDKAFIDDMIIHHQGAVDMAELALTATTRPEILELSKAIIEAQTKEIEMMKQWRMAWF